MKPTHLLAGLSLSAACLLDVAVATALETYPDPALMVFLGLAFGQLALLGIWTVLGTVAWLLRVLTMVAAAALLSGPIAAVTAGGWSEWFTILCLFCGAVVLLVSAFRCWGLAFSTRGSDEEDTPARCRLACTQYSLGGILSVMTAIGLVLGLGRHVTFPWQHTLVLAGYGTCLLLVAVSSLWAVASSRSAPARLAILAGVCLIAGAVMDSLEPAQNIWFFTMVVFIEAIVVCWGVTILSGAHVHISRIQKSCRSM
jgi:hypothetical protein